MNHSGLVGCRIIRFDVVDSTNEKAKELLDESVEEGTVVVAERQAAGRGRYGRAWASPPGGLYLSIILKPEERKVQLLSLLSGLPIVEALREYDVEARLKWPNDVLVGDRKIGGILCEGVYRHDEFYAIVGIGVNTASDMKRLPADLQRIATTLKRETRRAFDNEAFLEVLLEEYGEFHEDYRAGQVDSLLSDYRKTCVTLGGDVVVETARGTVRGQACDVSSLGALVVESSGGKVEVFEGTVLHSRRRE